MMMLADVTNGVVAGFADPHAAQSIGWALIIVVSIVTGVNQVMKLVDRARGKELVQQPVTVREATIYVRKEECMARHNESEKRFTQVERQIDDLRLERKKDTGDLHNRVTDVAREVSALAAETGVQTQRLASMDAKLDRLIERRLERM